MTIQSFDADSNSFPIAQLIQKTLRPILGQDSQPEAGASAADFSAKTLQDLQWAEVLELLVERALSAEGREVLGQLVPLSNKQEIERRLGETREAMELLAEDDLPPLMGLRDIRRALEHVKRQGVLVGEDLAAVAQNCDVASRVSRFFASRQTRVPLLGEVGTQINALDELRRELHAAVDPSGQLSERASPALRKLRRTVQFQHDRLRSRVDQQLRRADLEVHLQDDYYTVREDRYVLPVRASARARVPGIVHGYSSTGQTAFIEPAELVDLNNELRWAEIELMEEEKRIFAQLSARVARDAESLARNIHMLTYLDVIIAQARFSEDINATIPSLSGGEVELKQLRHPLLFLQRGEGADEEQGEVVANDLVLDPERKVLVISGPNTGGKTVLLKAFGLCGLMLHFGLPLPVDEGSKLPLFDSIFSDIGDEQSIERDLSTFSSHLQNINDFLGRCGPRSLVLLDELFTGTDPLQGAALAVSLLEELVRRGSTAAVTTHLENLKTLAIQNTAFANASMGFNLESLEPTYRLTLGVPGSSFAVRISRRLGFPEALIDRAVEVLEGEDHHTVDEVLATLEDQLHQVHAERNRMEQARRHAEQQKRKFERKYQALLEKERGAIHQESRELREQLRQARELVREQMRALKKSGVADRSSRLNQKELAAIQKKLEGADKKVSKAREKTRPLKVGARGLARVPADEIREGMQVFVSSFNRVGALLQYAEGDPKALVQLGVLKASVDLDELYYPSEAQRQKQGGKGAKSRASRRDEEPAPSPDAGLNIPQTSENTVDLRGCRVDEAIEQLDLFLDHAYLTSQPGVFIIHGHGTGALKRAVRGHMLESRYIGEFRRGERHEGGDGVTVAQIAAELRK